MRWLSKSLLTLALAATSAPALAGVYTDDLGKCLVQSSSPDDQLILVKWIFLAMAAHPGIAPYTNVTPTEDVDIQKKGGQLFERLLISDCHAQVVSALKYEGPSALSDSFKLLGEIAMRGLMSDPHVQQNLAGLGTYVDSQKLQALFQEAGLPTNDPQQSAPAK